MTSHVNKAILVPKQEISLLVIFNLLESISMSEMLAPCSASIFAIPAPNPPAPPVIMAVLLSKFL